MNAPYEWAAVKPLGSAPRLSPTLVLDHTPQELADKLDARAFANALLGGMAAANVATAMAVQAGEREAYIELLKRHDWEHQHSDDHRAYTRGRDELARLRVLQPVVDPDGALWNAAAPEAHRVVA